MQQYVIHKPRNMNVQENAKVSSKDMNDIIIVLSLLIRLELGLPTVCIIIKKLFNKPVLMESLREKE